MSEQLPRPLFVDEQPNRLTPNTPEQDTPQPPTATQEEVTDTPEISTHPTQTDELKIVLGGLRFVSRFRLYRTNRKLAEAKTELPRKENLRNERKMAKIATAGTVNMGYRSTYGAPVIGAPDRLSDDRIQSKHDANVRKIEKLRAKIIGIEDYKERLEVKKEKLERKLGIFKNPETTTEPPTEAVAETRVLNSTPTKSPEQVDVTNTPDTTTQQDQKANEQEPQVSTMTDEHATKSINERIADMDEEDVRHLSLIDEAAEQKIRQEMPALMALESEKRQARQRAIRAEIYRKYLGDDLSDESIDDIFKIVKQLQKKSSNN